MRHIKIFSCLSALMIFLLSAPQAHAFFFQQEKITTSKGLAHYSMGQIYDLLGMVKRAALEYEKAVQFDNKSYLIRLRLGANYARLGLLSRAIEELQYAGILNDEDLQAHYLLALIYSTQKNYDKAAEEYEFILKKYSKVEPKNIEIYGYLGQLYYSQRKYDQAVKQFEKVLELEPKNTDVMYLLGSLYLEVDRKVEAIDLLKLSIDIDPRHDGSLNTLGYIYAEQGIHLDKAENFILRALEIDPDNGAYLDSLGWAYYKNEKYNEALEIFKKAENLLEDSVIYDHIGDVYFKLNDIESANKYWKLSLELSPKQEDVIKKLEEAQSVQASR
ncbi:hypothetical protein MNBD_UNCLBAC01-939 [hydrothermal vent metagenome]|uniref:Uncharacterized protein n=1 Tax=hydrothermal vent metagenome TaxID=652676 RepID=A0A3B1DEA7_9ZZZZ